MLPCIRPDPVRGDIADVVIGEGSSIVIFQQVTPVDRVGVGCGIRRRTQRSGGVGIFIPGCNIARIIIGPRPGLPGCLVVLPDQLVG